MIASQKRTYVTPVGRFLLRGLGTGALALVVCAAALPAAAQERNNSQYAPPDRQQADQQQAPADQGQYSNNQPVPATLTLPAGTVVQVRVDDRLSSDKNQSGDRFSATLDQPLIANGWVVARRGQVVTGRVEVAQKAGHGNPASKLGLALSELTLVDGQVLPVNTQLVQAGTRPNANNTGRDVAMVGNDYRTRCHHRRYCRRRNRRGDWRRRRRGGWRDWRDEHPWRSHRRPTGKPVDVPAGGAAGRFNRAQPGSLPTRGPG